MNKIFAIARWEYLERVKSKAFIISIFLTPLIIFFFTYLPGKFAGEEKDSIKAIGILDTTNIYVKPLSKKLYDFKLPDGQPRYVAVNLYDKSVPFQELRKKINKDLGKNKIEGFLFIFKNVNDSLTIHYISPSVANPMDIMRFEKAFNAVRREMEFDKAGIDKKYIDIISKNVDVKTIEIDKEGKESKSDFYGKFISALVLMIILMIMILSSGGMLIRSLVEEKSNRLIEILISSCKPTDLLTGKIIGLSLLAITQVVIWIIITVSFMGESLLLFSSFDNFFLMLIYFLLGFVFYTSIFVGVGSIAGTEQEAQQLTSYLSILIMAPIAVLIPIMQNPDLTIVKILSYIPFTIPTVMMLKISSGTTNMVEIILTILLLIASTGITIYISAKIFKVGILSYGKRPSLKELIQWIKAA